MIRTAVSSKRSRGLTGEPGLPDLCLPGLSAWLEIKLPGKALRPAQVVWHEKAKNEGVRVATVTSVQEAVWAVQQFRAEVWGRALGEATGLSRVAPRPR